MKVEFAALRKEYRVSSLCEIMVANLLPCEEEGVSRHFLHQLPTPLIWDQRGLLAENSPRRVAVVLGLVRHTELAALLSSGCAQEPTPPYESLFLELPVGDPVIQPRPQLMEEASQIFVQLADEGRKVILVAFPHRRLIGRSLVIRHHPAALFDLDRKPLWVHPAANSYGLLNCLFPSHQRVRTLGPKHQCPEVPEDRRGMDDETGLPVWFKFARENLYRDPNEDEPLFQAIVDYQAQCLLQLSVAQDVEEALRESTMQFLRGFETYFGMGGLRPRPGDLGFVRRQ